MYYYPKKKKRKKNGVGTAACCSRYGEPLKLQASLSNRQLNTGPAPPWGGCRSSVKLSIHHHIIFSILKNTSQPNTNRKCVFFFPFYRKWLSNLLVPGSNKCPVMPSRAYVALYTLDTAVLKEPNIILIVRFCAVFFHLNEKIKSFWHFQEIVLGSSTYGQGVG